MPNDAGSATIDDNSSVDLGVGENEDFSIEAFFYTPDLSYEAEHVDVLARKNKCFSFYIQFNSEEPDKLFFTITILGYGEILLWNETNIQVGWHHVAAVFDNEYTADEDAFTIFLDGVRVAHSPDEDIHVDWTPGIPNSTSPLEIGGVWGGHAGFNGYLEEIRISDIVRYSGLTYAIPTTPFSSDANTRALWHFDESPGSSVFMDDSSYGNNLTGHDGAQTYTP